MSARLVDQGCRKVGSQLCLNRHHLNFRFSKEIARRMAWLQTSSTCQRYRLPVDSSRLDFERDTMIPGELLKPSSLISLTSLKVSLLKSCSYSLNSIGHELASTNQKVGRVETVCPRRPLGSKMSAAHLTGMALFSYRISFPWTFHWGMLSSSSLPPATLRASAANST